MWDAPQRRMVAQPALTTMNRMATATTASASQRQLDSDATLSRQAENLDRRGHVVEGEAEVAGHRLLVYSRALEAGIGTWLPL